MRVITSFLLLAALVAPAASALELSGRVLDREGAPIEGARAVLAAFLELEERAERILAGELTYDPLDEVATGAAGRYRLEAPEPGLYAVIIDAPGRRQVVHMVTPLLGATVLPDAQPTPVKPLRVKVVDAEGRPLPDVRLRLVARPRTRHDHRAWRPQTARAFTGEDGTATLDGGEGERRWLTLDAAGFAGEMIETDRSTLTVELERGEQRLLRFVDERGRGVPAMLLRRLEPLGRADEDGYLEVRVSGDFSSHGLQLRAYAGELEASYRLEQDEQDEKGADEKGKEAIEIETQVVEMGPLPEWFGTVVDKRTGQPISGALVWSQRRVSRSVKSDGRGEFTIAFEPRERIAGELFATAAGYDLGWIDRYADEQAPLRFALEPQDELRGRVFGPDEQPIEGARIQASTADPYGASRKHSSISTVDGRFAVSVPLGERLTVRASAAGFGSRQVDVAAEQRQAIRIELGPLRSAFGVVVDPQDRPVVGAEVALRAADGSGAFWGRHASAPTMAKSGAGGRFVLEDFEPGRYFLHIQAEGWPPIERHSVELPEAPLETELGRLRLEEGVALEGRVLGDGEPLEGAFVRVVGRHVGLSHQGHTATDSDGRFTIEGLRKDLRVSLYLDKEGYFARPFPVDLPSEALEIEMRRSASITGRVLDPEGRPIHRAMVQVGKSGSSSGTSTDEEGFFEHESPPGRYSLRVQAEGFRPYERADFTVESGETAPLEIVMQKGLSLGGTIYDPDGSPLAEAYVYAAGTYELAPERTGPDGRFALDGLVAGSVQLEVGHEKWGRLSEEIELRASRQGLEMQFPHGAVLSGLVFDENSGSAVADAMIVLSGGSSPSNRQARSEADGSFRLEHITDGRYSLEAHHPDYAPAEVEVIEVAGFDVGDLELAMSAGGELRGRVVGVAPEKVQQLQLRLAGGTQVRRTMVDTAGAFRFDRLGEGSWRLSARAEDGREARESVTIEAAAPPPEVELRFDDGGFEVTGEVSRGGEPLAGVMVRLVPSGFSRVAHTVTDHRGFFTLRGVRDGAHQVTLHLDNQTLASREVDVTGDDHWSFDLRGGLVEGRVVDAAGVGLAQAHIQLRNTRIGSASLSASSDAQGRFFWEHVPADTYELQVSLEGYAMAPRRLEVGEVGTRGLEVVLETASGVVLHPLRADGSRPEMVSIARLDAAGRPADAAHLPVDESGAAHHRSLPAGSWKLLIAEPGGAAVEWPVTVSAEGPSDGGSPRLPASGEVVLHAPALAADGIGLRLRAHDAGGRPYRSLRGEHWQFGEKIVQPLPVGTWRLEIEAADGRTWQRDVTVAAGAVTELELP